MLGDGLRRRSKDEGRTVVVEVDPTLLADLEDGPSAHFLATRGRRSGSAEPGSGRDRPGHRRTRRGGGRTVLGLRPDTDARGADDPAGHVRRPAGRTAARDRIALAGPRSGGSGCLQHRDFHQVVRENAVPGPDPGTVDAIQAGAVPPVAVPEGADPPFTASAPFDPCAERGSAFVPLPRRPGLAFSGNGNGSNHLSTDVPAATRRGRGATAAMLLRFELPVRLPGAYPKRRAESRYQCGRS